MNAYITAGNPYSLNTNFYGYTPGTGATHQAPAFQESFIPQGPHDSVVLSSDATSGNFNFGVQDLCDCQFGNGVSQDAFIVPAGDQDNPYQNYNATAMDLPALNGQNPQQALLALLESLGFTPEMLQALQAMGINLLDLIVEANGLDNLNQLQTGQELVLPTTIPATSDQPAPVYMPVNTNSASQSQTTNNSPAPASAPVPTPAPAPAPRLTPGREDAHSRMGANGGQGPNPNRTAPRLTPGREDAHSRMGANGGQGPNPNRTAPRNGGGGGGRVTVR